MALPTILLSFGEGLAIIASPCIYPVAPLLVSSSTSGGRGRPWAVAAGFFVCFTAFVFLARYLVRFFGIMPQTIKYLSLAFLLFFGILLLVEPFEKTMQKLSSGILATIAGRGARAIHHAETNWRNDLLTGFFVGGAIGLVWSPCIGPIVAVVMAQVIRETDNLSALWVVLAFAIGVTLPFLAIGLLGRRAMDHFHWLPKNNHLVKKLLGAVIIASTLWVAVSANAAEEQPVQTFGDQVYDKPLSFPAPNFVGITQWLNTDKNLSLSDLRGKVVVVNFWTYSCINCRNTLPAVVGWYKKYKDKGLLVVGIHSPELTGDRDIASIKAAVARHGITYPVGVDNNLSTWDNYHNDCWPAFYFINKYGRVVRALCGEHNYSATDAYLAELLKQ